jgi:Uma2 family endonuclease
MSNRMTVDAYLAGEETTRPRELAYGVVREPPAPSFDHQLVVGRLYARLERHVREMSAGRVIPSPVDVILDNRRALIVQPDIVFVATERLGMCTDRIWGAPDLVIEVLSTATRRHDQTAKLTWYRDHGVHECWIVDPVARAIRVIDLWSSGEGRVFEDTQIVRSHVLPRLRLRAAAAFAHTIP